MSVTLEHVTIQYGQLKAVNDVSATFPHGSTGLLGPNGAGKSSLIKGLLSLVSIHSGKASILGKDVAQERKAIRQLIGYMPEDDCLIPGLTGIGMVQYTGELSGMSRSDAMQRAHELLFVVGLEEARYRNVETYSAGMKQRIKLAQALVHDPELLFLDEPTSGMDPKGRQEMLDLIEDISHRGRMSIVLASHILVDVERTCQRVVIMNRGKVLEQGSVEDLRKSYAGTYTVRIEGDQEKFINALKRAKCVVQPNGNTLWDVTLPKGKRTDLILTAAKETRVQIRRLVASVQTLEDVFVKLIGEEQHADL
ncbi:ABC transporter ATP-binding protein [bacterium]|nr:ABC transporter ATP-binding protein [bacterium]RQV96730.1 MAG: ABC transporter ATP-binding protein [bacterium]